VVIWGRPGVEQYHPGYIVGIRPPERGAQGGKQAGRDVGVRGWPAPHEVVRRVYFLAAQSPLSVVMTQINRLNPDAPDLTELLFDIVRGRSFYGVLDAFTEACARSARLINEDLQRPDLDPGVKAQREREMDFYECATEHLRLSRSIIETDAQIRSTAFNEARTDVS
jgi:hypothetical protein